MTKITSKRYIQMEEALDAYCGECPSCLFDKYGNDCLLIEIKELLREHVEEGER